MSSSFQDKMAAFSPPKHTSGFLVAPRVPQGLAAAVEGLTREVIRKKPEDIYVFAARHFENLLQLREQYEASTPPLQRDPRTLRDMGLTHLVSPERQKTSTRARLEAERSGWSLNQTAKVLKRHRSIVADSPTQDAFHPPSSVSPPLHTCSKATKNPRKLSKPLATSPSSSSQSGDSEARTTPKILSRMSTEMTSRDIKNELRKNRISSRERRSKPRRTESEDSTLKPDSMSSDTPKKPTKRSDRARRPEDRRRDQQNGGSPSDDKMSRTPSMDKVKDYVVRKFSSTKSLEELQSLNYVQQVQNIIDSTEPIIREKMEELKNGIINSRKTSNASDLTRAPQAPADILETRLNDTQRLLESVSSCLSKPPGRSRSARALRRIRSVSMISTEDINGGSHEKSEEFMISELLISNGQRDGLDVRIKDLDNPEDRKYRRSRSAKGSRKSANIFEPEKTPDNCSQNEALETMLNETRTILAGISSSFSFQNGYKRSRGSGSASSSSKSEDCDFQDPMGQSKVSLPEVRPKSSKNTSRNLQKNNVGDIVLPAISPEAPKSAKVKEELILPVLLPPTSAKDPEIPEIPVEEVFKDSLNVTPEPSDLQRPDSLEPEERIEDIEPPSELKQKLLEIHEAEEKISKVFRSESIPAPEEIEPTESDDELKRKLMELMEVEREIESTLDCAKKSASPDEGSPNRHQPDDDEKLPTSSRASVGRQEDPNVSPHTYVLTEGSPYDIPESVTTVIIPEHAPSPVPDDQKLPQVPEESEQPKKSSDPFGEEITPEEPRESSIAMTPKKHEMMPKKPEIVIPKQNLQCINEEEDPEEEETIDNGTSDPPTSFLDVEEETIDLKSSGMDASEEFERPECVSMSSTSAKETSITDGPMETPHPPDSGEDVSSVSASAESSNEAKETTLTDGTSFSIDPTRPFVPELNLDSLQDITVSSFKMTEDEYEPGDNENTNSFTETLTPDERDRGQRREDEGLDGCEDADEDGGSESVEARLAEDAEEEGKDLGTSEKPREVVEEIFVQEFVEVREPLCEKKTAYVTGPEEDVGDGAGAGASRQDHPEDKSPGAHEESDLDKEKMDEEKESESDQGTDNFTEEETPLAVSRSASQCTTRRVSSGNLARMRGACLEEGEEEVKGRDEARVKFVGENENEGDPGEVGDEIDIAAVGDDAEDDRERMESKEYHIYVPELDQSEESTTESSFNSAATKIQAGVRGFLTRRRLQRMHHLNSTLNGVPSIQDSIVIDERPLEALDVPEKDLLELEGAATTIQSNFRGYKARKRLRREDAMQRTTISMERAFGEDGLRHTGEFHDCIPLPLLDFPPRILTSDYPQNDPNEGDKSPKQTLGMMFEIAPGVPVLQFGLPPKITKLVDLVVLAKDENAVESGYLNFITSVEDAEASPATEAFFRPPATAGSDASGESTRDFVELSPRKGVIIEEITSLEEAKILSEMRAKETPATPVTPENPECPDKSTEELESTKEAPDTPQGEEASTPLEDDSGKVLEKPGIDIAGALEAPLATLGFPMKEGKLLHYGSEDSVASHDRRPLLEVTLTPGDPMKSLSLSQESQLAGERIESPITMMQIVPGRGPSLLQDDSGEILAGEDKKEGAGPLEANGSNEETKRDGE